MTAATAISPYDAMTVTVPEGTSGNVEVRRFEVDDSAARMSFMNNRGRGVRAGTYTALYRSGQLWMSDTPDEQRDHWPALWEAKRQGARRALVNGLGIGMVVAALLHFETIEHVDVVEHDPDVIALVGPHYEAMAADLGKTIAIHHDDAFAIKWPTGSAWDIAWHDVWIDLCTDNLASMATLHRRYGRRVRWQGSWGRALLERQRDHERRNGWW